MSDDDEKNKQQYLQQAIINAGYDPNNFTEFIASKKGILTY